jgi:hypothetical protein
MTRAQAFWDDDVEGLAHRFRFGKAEDSRGTEVPKSDDALGVGINDRVGGFTEVRMRQAADVDDHGIIRNGRCSVGHRFPT